MTTDKILTIGDLEKAIKEHRINPRRIKRDAPDEFREWVKGYNVGLKVALKKIGELKLFLEETLGKTDFDWASLGLTVNDVARLVKEETTHRILGDDKSG